MTTVTEYQRKWNWAREWEVVSVESVRKVFAEHFDDPQPAHHQLEAGEDVPSGVAVYRKRVVPVSVPVIEPKTFVFSCPNCGDPSAVTEEDEVAIHSRAGGAMYTCNECHEDVIFVAVKTQHYDALMHAATALKKLD